jgi:UDP-glucose 4-epimerase
VEVLLTGGAGFLGRWVCARLLADGHRMVVVDNLSNGRLSNLEELRGDPGLRVEVADVRDRAAMDSIFSDFDLCLHLAAQINVQSSIDDPAETFDNDTIATFHLLERCRTHDVRFVLMSTCMVYDRASDGAPISEDHPTKPASPYAAAKLAAEALTLSYAHAYGMPTAVLRPFNTYGPYQKTSGEGGVVAIFISRRLEGLPLRIYGDGTQTRDLLYVEDCADFVVGAATSERCWGQILNAGTGHDVTINELAEHVAENQVAIQHVPHIHPQSEIMRLACDPSRAEAVLGWRAQTSLAVGIERTTAWIADQRQSVATAAGRKED